MSKFNKTKNSNHKRKVIKVPVSIPKQNINVKNTEKNLEIIFIGHDKNRGVPRRGKYHKKLQSDVDRTIDK